MFCFNFIGITALESATDAAIHKKVFESVTRPLDLAKQRALIISNEEMNNIRRIVKSLEESGLLIERISKTI